MTATRLAIFAIAACAVGCLSEEPIASGSPEPMDPRLLGSWRCVVPDDKDATTLTITEAENRGVRAVFVSGDQEPSAFTAYAVKFEGGRLLNVALDDKGKNWWTVAQYTLYRPTVLYVEYPKYDNKTLKNAKTPTQWRDALKRAHKAKTLFEDSMTCVRIVEQESHK